MRKESIVQDLRLLEHIPNNWEVVPFTLVVKDCSGGNIKLQKGEYLQNGKFAVVDQGKEYIAGFSNSREALVKHECPYVIFGDHTRLLKYIDFPFIMGADGVKVLKVLSEKKLTHRYLFFYLKSISIPNTGYNRHFKYLKELKIPLPPLEEQKKIAAILDKADKIRQINKDLIKKYDELTQSLFIDMFGDPVTNPIGWEKISLDNLGKITSGSTPSRKNEKYYNGNIPWVKTGEVNGRLIYDTEEKISEEGLNNSSCKLYPIDSIIIAMYGQGKTRGQVGVLGIKATTNQACAVIPPSKDVDVVFVFKLLQQSYDDLRLLGRGGNQPNINIGLIKNYQIITPPLCLQQVFAKRVEAIEKQKAMAQESLNKSEDLFNSLMQKAFKGELQ